MIQSLILKTSSFFRITLCVILICLCFSSCRSSKDIQDNYNENVDYDFIFSRQKEEIEKSELNLLGKLEKYTEEYWEQKVKEENNKKSASIESITDYYEDGSPKTSTTKIYVNDEQSIKESSESRINKAIELALVEYEKSSEKRFSEMEVIIENLKQDIEALKVENSKSDSRLIQGVEWLWVGIIIVLIIAAIATGIYLFLKEKRKND